MQKLSGVHLVLSIVVLLCFHQSLLATPDAPPEFFSRLPFKIAQWYGLPDHWPPQTPKEPDPDAHLMVVPPRLTGGSCSPTGKYLLDISETVEVNAKSPTDRNLVFDIHDYLFTIGIGAAKWREVYLRKTSTALGGCCWYSNTDRVLLWTTGIKSSTIWVIDLKSRIVDKFTYTYRDGIYWLQPSSDGKTFLICTFGNGNKNQLFLISTRDLHSRVQICLPNGYYYDDQNEVSISPGMHEIACRKKYDNGDILSIYNLGTKQTLPIFSTVDSTLEHASSTQRRIVHFAWVSNGSSLFVEESITNADKRYHSNRLWLVSKKGEKILIVSDVWIESHSSNGLTWIFCTDDHKKYYVRASK